MFTLNAIFHYFFLVVLGKEVKVDPSNCKTTFLVELQMRRSAVACPRFKYFGILAFGCFYCTSYQLFANTSLITIAVFLINLNQTAFSHHVSNDSHTGINTVFCLCKVVCFRVIVNVCIDLVYTGQRMQNFNVILSMLKHAVA